VIGIVISRLALTSVELKTIVSFAVPTLKLGASINTETLTTFDVTPLGPLTLNENKSVPV